MTSIRMRHVQAVQEFGVLLQTPTNHSGLSSATELRAVDRQICGSGKTIDRIAAAANRGSPVAHAFVERTFCALLATKTLKPRCYLTDKRTKRYYKENAALLNL
jgi:hypothetical protein